MSLQFFYCQLRTIVIHSELDSLTVREYHIYTEVIFGCVISTFNLSKLCIGICLHLAKEDSFLNLIFIKMQLPSKEINRHWRDNRQNWDVK